MIQARVPSPAGARITMAIGPTRGLEGAGPSSSRKPSLRDGTCPAQQAAPRQSPSGGLSQSISRHRSSASALASATSMILREKSPLKMPTSPKTPHFRMEHRRVPKKSCSSIKTGEKADRKLMRGSSSFREPPAQNMIIDLLTAIH